MVGWLKGAHSAARTATVMVQSLLTFKLDSELAIRVAEIKGFLLVLQSQLEYAQEDQIAMAHRIVDLEAEIVRHERWKREQERYRLHQMPIGGLVYCTKPVDQGFESPHDRRTSCYQEDVKSILQAMPIPSRDNWQMIQVCHRYKSLVMVSRYTMNKVDLDAGYDWY